MAVAMGAENPAIYQTCTVADGKLISFGFDVNSVSFQRIFIEISEKILNDI
jgi:hypothetical protein